MDQQTQTETQQTQQTQQNAADVIITEAEVVIDFANESEIRAAAEKGLAEGIDKTVGLPPELASVDALLESVRKRNNDICKEIVNQLVGEPLTQEMIDLAYFTATCSQYHAYNLAGIRLAVRKIRVTCSDGRSLELVNTDLAGR